MNSLNQTARGPAALAALTSIGLLLAGCGGSGSSTSAKATSSTPPATSMTSTSAGMSGSGKTVTVGETEFKLSLSTSTFAPGAWTFAVVNKGTTTHALEIDGPGVEDRKSGALAPGDSTKMAVTLQKGTYQLYCPVDGHKGLGMQTSITVK
jgi:uncharacterized cupredoxin-like copper-binding protein